MKVFIKKLVLPFLILFFGFIKANDTPGVPCGIPGFNPCSPPPSPIDMYVYVLAIIAILAIAYFAKKYKPQKI